MTHATTASPSPTTVTWIDLLGLAVALGALTLAIIEGLDAGLTTGGMPLGGQLATFTPFVALVQGHMARLERQCQTDPSMVIPEVVTMAPEDSDAAPSIAHGSPVRVRRRRVVGGQRVWPSALRRRRRARTDARPFDEEAWFAEGLRIARGEVPDPTWTFFS